MKAARAELVDRDTKPPNITIRRLPSDPARRQRLVHLLAVLLDKPDTPEKDGQP